MSRESRRQRGARYEIYKAQREAKYRGREEAKKTFTKNYTVDQKKVGKVIGVLEAYYGNEDFRKSNYTSGELLDMYEKIFINNEEIPKLNEQEIEEVNKEAKRRSLPIQVQEPQKPKLAVDINAIQTRLKTEFPW